MKSSKQIPWQRVGIEAFAIVASILLAFAIDAWWQERLARAVEIQELDRLRSEFIDNMTMIDERSYETDILNASIEVFDLIGAAQSAGETSIDVPATGLVLMLAAPTFDTDTPILDGLIRSGRLEIIRDPRIPAALADWDRLLRDYTSFAGRARRSVDQHLLPALTLRADIGPVLIIPTLSNRIDPSRYGGLTVTVRIDDELKGLVADRWRNGSYAVRRPDDARKATEDVVRAIEASQVR